MSAAAWEGWYSAAYAVAILSGMTVLLVAAFLPMLVDPSIGNVSRRVVAAVLVAAVLLFVAAVWLVAYSSEVLR